MKQSTPEMHLFEYATIRFLPQVEREEFLNVGVILYCPAQGFLQTLYQLDNRRLSIFNAHTDLDELHQRLQVFERICQGKKHGGIIGQMPIAGRFRWLTASRSTIIQTSAVHTGLCSDAEETIKHLFDQLVR